MSSSISGDLGGESRLLLETMGRTAEAGLSPGQRLPARVIETLLTGDVLLELGRSRVTVPTSTPLQPGERVRVEVVKAGATPEFRIVADSKTAGAAPPALALVTGQRLAARVVETLTSGDVLLDLGANRAVVVRASGPMQPGEPVVLDVVSGGAKPELRMVTDKATLSPQTVSPQAVQPQAVSRQPAPSQAVPSQAVPAQGMLPQAASAQPQGVAASPAALTPPVAPPPAALPLPAALTPRDLPVIMRALAEMAPNGIPTVPVAQAGQTFQTFLRTAVAADLPGPVVAQIQRLLAPLQATLPAAELAPMLRASLSQSGLFTENHLGAVLRQHPGPLGLPGPPSQPGPLSQPGALGQPGAAGQPGGAGQPGAVGEPSAVDRPGPLGQPGSPGAPGASGAAGSPGQPGSLTAEQRQAIADVRLLLGALTPAGTPVPEPVRAFGDAVLQQQLIVAEQVAATGGGQVAIPFMFGEERVDIRFTWDREARQETQERSARDDDRPISLGVFVNMNIFGAIEARIIWKPESFAVTFYVEREATRAIVEAGLSELSKELSASGFSAVDANVWLNPERVLAGVSAGATPVRPAIPAGTILDVMV